MHVKARFQLPPADFILRSHLLKGEIPCSISEVQITPREPFSSLTRDVKAGSKRHDCELSNQVIKMIIIATTHA